MKRKNNDKVFLKDIFKRYFYGRYNIYIIRMEKIHRYIYIHIYIDESFFIKSIISFASSLNKIFVTLKKCGICTKFS